MTCCSKRAVADLVAALNARKSSRPPACAANAAKARSALLDQYFAIAVSRHRRDQARALHVLDEAGGAVVADAQVPLDEGDGSTLVLQDDLDGLVIKGVGLSRHAALARSSLAVGGFGSVEDAVRSEEHTSELQ